MENQSAPTHLVLFEIPQDRRFKTIAANLAKCLLVAGLVAAVTISLSYWIIFSGFVFSLLFAMCLFTMTVRIVADERGISIFNLFGSKSIPFEDIKSADIYFACGRGSTRMLRVSGITKNSLDIYGVSLTDKQLSEIQDFIAQRCLEITGKPISITKLADDAAFIPILGAIDKSKGSE